MLNWLGLAWSTSLHEALKCLYKPWKDWKNICVSILEGLHSIIFYNDISLLATSNNNTYFTNRLTVNSWKPADSGKGFPSTRTIYFIYYTCFMNSSPWNFWNQIQVVGKNVHKIFTLFLVIHGDSWLPIKIFTKRIIKQSNISFPTNRQRLLDRKKTHPQEFLKLCQVSPIFGPSP